MKLVQQKVNKRYQPMASPRGFTMIELIAVIGITGILLTIISAIFASIVQTNVRATISNEIRESGQLMMEQMVRDIRGATSVSPTGTTNYITIASPAGTTTYYFKCGNLYKNDDSSQINSSKVLVDRPDAPPAACGCGVGVIDCPATSGSNFVVTQPTGGAPARVRLTINLKTNGTPSHQEYIGTQTFVEEVTQRTYSK